MHNDEWMYLLQRLSGSKERLLILQFLGTQETGVFSSTISTETGIKPTVLSKMLRDLEGLGYIHGDLAANERRGRAVRYTLQPARIRAVLRAAAEQLNVEL